MLALKVLGGLLLFIPGFVFVGAGAAALSQRHRTGQAFTLLSVGLAAVLAVVLVYGRLVR